MEKEYDTLGLHIIVDCFGVSAQALDDLQYLKDLLTQAVEVTGANILGNLENKFEPNGVTLLNLLSESHASIHTYPDKGYISCDIYTCGTHIDTKKGVDFLLGALNPKQVNGVMIQRGNINGFEVVPYIYPKGD